MTTHTFRIALLLILTVFYSLDAYSETDPWPAITADGLHRVYIPEFGVVYVKPGNKLTDYHHLKILKPVVSFEKGRVGEEEWANESQAGMPSAEETLRVRSRISERFHEIFTRKMADGGYHLTDEAGTGVLLIRPAIINLALISSESHGAGEVTLYVELFDSVTGERLAEAWDQQTGQSADTGLENWAVEANREMGLRAIDEWAKSMQSALSGMKGQKIPWGVIAPLGP